MSDEPQRSTGSSSNSGIGAIVAIVVVLPLVYGLSIGPVHYVTEKLHITSSVAPAAQIFYAPLKWVYDKTPLSGPINVYLRWWEKVIRP